MPQARTLDVRMEVQKASIAVASVAQEDGAEVISLGTIGTRPCAIDKLLRPLQSKRPPLVFVSEAGPCGPSIAGSLGEVAWGSVSTPEPDDVTRSPRSVWGCRSRTRRTLELSLLAHNDDFR